MGTGLISALVGLFCTIVTSIITFLLTRKKYNSEVESQQIQNLNDAFTLYKKTMEDSMASQNKAYEATINSLNAKVDTLSEENSDLRKQVSQLQMEMINILGTICLDTTCKMRQVNLPAKKEDKKK